MMMMDDDDDEDEGPQVPAMMKLFLSSGTISSLLRRVGSQQKAFAQQKEEDLPQF